MLLPFPQACLRSRPQRPTLEPRVGPCQSPCSSPDHWIFLGFFLGMCSGSDCQHWQPACWRLLARIVPARACLPVQGSSAKASAPACDAPCPATRPDLHPRSAPCAPRPQTRPPQAGMLTRCARTWPTFTPRPRTPQVGWAGAPLQPLAVPVIPLPVDRRGPYCYQHWFVFCTYFQPVVSTRARAPLPLPPPCRQQGRPGCGAHPA